MDERFLPIYIVLRETGGRRGEVLGLTHDRVDRERRMVTFVKTKTGKVWHMFLSDAAMEAIDSVPPFPGCPYVFYNPKTGTRWYDARKPWEAARKAANHPELKPKNLRTAMGTRLGEAGLELDWICRVLGNTRALQRSTTRKVGPETASKRALKVLKGGK